MQKSIKGKIADNRGEIMLEASIILVAVLILLMALLSITFMFYQQAVMTSVATEIAQDVAKNMKFNALPIGTSEFDKEDYNDTQMFRTNLGQIWLQTAKEELADTYSVKRLDVANFGINSGDFEVSVNLKASGIGRMYAVVTVSQPSEFFLSGILDMVGMADEKTTFSATAYAECHDMIGYSSMVNFTDYMTTKLKAFNAFGDLYVSVKGFINILLGN